MARLLLVLPTATYRAGDFLAAARTLGAEVVVASERRLVSLGGAQLTLDLRRPEAAAEAIAAAAKQRPLDAVVAVDDQGVRVAALAAERLGLPGNRLQAVAATGPWPLVVRSRVWSWMTTSLPSEDRWTSHSIRSQPAAMAERNDRMVFSGCSAGLPRCPPSSGRPSSCAPS